MKTKFTRGRLIAGMALAAVAIVLAGSGSFAQEAAAVAISVKGHQFQPAEIHAPANKPLAIRVKYSMPCRWNSRACRCGWRRSSSPVAKGVVNVRPLAPGRYEFFDDFHQQTRGFLVVQ